MRTGTRPFPSGWRREPLSQHIVSFCSGIARGDKSRNTGFMHLRMNNITDRGTIDLSSVWRIPASEKEIATCALNPGDVLFNNTNSRALVGKTCVFHGVEGSEPVLFSNHITRIRTKPSLSPRYLAFWINVLWQKGFFTGKCDVWVNQAAIRVEDQLFPLLIPVPPTPADQDAIAAKLERKLSNVESMRQAAERQTDALGVAQQSLLREVFGRSGNSGWRTTKLGQLAEVVMGQSPDGSTYNREAKGLPLLNGPTEFGEDHPIPAQWTTSPRKTGRTGDILICVRGNTTGRMNRADQVYCLGRGIAAIRGRDGKGDTRFIRHAIRFKVAELLSGSERATFPNIGKDDIEGFAVSAPQTVAEQSAMADQIETKLRSLNTTVAAAARQQEAITALPGAILREAFDFCEN